MPPVRRISFVDQTTGLLREGIASGRWKERLPGLRKLASEFTVSRQTLRLALNRLVEEGVLTPGGASESHTIVAGVVAPATGPRPLRIAILLMNPVSELANAPHRIIMEMAVRFEADGHRCTITGIPNDKNPDRLTTLSRLVENTGADLWLVNHGSIDVLGWFHQNGIAVLAMGGNHAGLPVPSISFDVTDNLREIADRLVELGHERIVLVTRRLMRHPEPGNGVRTMRAALEARGIRTGSYLAPEWDETPEGLETLMESLFKLTPPTAIISFSANYTIGITSFLARKGLKIPKDVSLVSYGEETSIGWLFPTLDITHFDCSDEPFLKTIRRWVFEYSQGRRDTQKHLITSPVHHGGSIGPAKRG